MSEHNADEVAEANANLIKWGVHVLGADDWYAAPSHADAVRMARRGNVLCAEHTRVNDLLWFAYAGPWPWDEASHAESLRAQEPDAPDRRE